MNKVLVIVFDSENQAKQASRQLADLHSEGAITVYSLDIVEKASDSQVEFEEPVHHNLLPYGLGPVIAGLVGMLGGALAIPLGVGAGAVAPGGSTGILYGSFISCMIYFAKMGGCEDFMNEVADFLRPGKVAVIAEVDEYQVLLTDARMALLGGVVFRQPLTNTYYIHIERDLAAIQAEIHALQSEHDRAADDEDRVKLRTRIESLKAKLHAMTEQAKDLEEATQRIAEAKLKSLSEQIATAHDWWKSVLTERVDEVRADYEERITRLRKARRAVLECETDEPAEHSLW